MHISGNFAALPALDIKRKRVYNNIANIVSNISGSEHMNYEKMANELLGLRSTRPQICFERELSKTVKGEYFVLDYLQKHGNRTYPKKLSSDMMVSTARIAVILNHLEKQHLIERIADTDDNRQTIVILSNEGIALLAEYHRHLTDYLTKILEKMGEKDAMEYIRLQKKIISILSEDIKG